MKKLLIAEATILLSGTIFAWLNFSTELFDWLENKSCTTGCSLGLANPFQSACFYGAIFFTIAFVISAIMLGKYLKKD
ncbi:MAG: hypothetical protein AB9915_02995 [Candidatus Dojkabacteria bacterium]